MLLRHLHVPGPTSYLQIARLQESLVRQCLDAKAARCAVPSTAAPTIITTQFTPVYTCGRRELGTVSADQQEYLRAQGKAEFHQALRGGQTTFHGPGQLIAYPILDLTMHKLTARSYVRLLERTLIQTCATYGIESMTTENPGVWVTPDSKIAAVGVHLRRSISSHGIALNLTTDLSWFERIVACGLIGKSTTSMQNEGVDPAACTLPAVAATFVRLFAQALALQVGPISPEQIQEQGVLIPG